MSPHTEVLEAANDIVLHNWPKDPEGCWLPDDEATAIRAIADPAGLRLIHDVYIADAVRELGER